MVGNKIMRIVGHAGRADKSAPTEDRSSLLIGIIGSLRCLGLAICDRPNELKSFDVGQLPAHQNSSIHLGVLDFFLSLWYNHAVLDRYQSGG